MANFKNIRIKMKGGKSRLQRVKVLASGKYKFVKNLTKSRSKSKSSNPSHMKKARKVYKKLAKKKTRRSNKFTLPLAPIIGLASGLATPRPGWGESALQLAMNGNFSSAMESVKQSYLGIAPDGSFRMDLLYHGLVPLIIGGLVHKFVGGAPLNLNRMLGQANVPIVRI